MTSTAPEERLRAWWAHRQGLDGGLAGATPAQVLSRTGWARSIGSSTPYLALFARAGLDRERVDADVAALAIHELPSVRGCAYLLPQRDFALGLTLGLAAAVADVSTATRKLPVTREEIDELRGTVLAILEAADAPMDPAAIREAAGGAVRSLGEEGKKKGHGTTLPMTLGLLQSQGRIRRVPAGGRLDQQRFGYVRWSPSPLDGYAADLDAAHTELARLYFGWAAPASLKHFQWFSGLSATIARKAVAPLGLMPVTGSEQLLLPPEQAEDFAAFQVPREPSYALVTAFDGVHLLHRDLGRLLDGPDAGRPVPGGKPGRVLGDEPDPPTMIIVDRGRIAGLWEYDVETRDIAYLAFGPADGALKEAVARTADFIREQLGDARTVSLDSPRGRAPRIAALHAG
jgi:hypothetical protein